MMGNARQLKTIGRHASQAYLKLGEALQSLGPGCHVRPEPAAAVFQQVAEGNLVRLNVKPMAFRLKEKANSPSAEMRVVLSGHVNFSADADRMAPRSCHFQTNVAYFLKKGSAVDHVFGVHYDYDNRLPGHPVYHAQCASQKGMLETSNSLLNEQLGLRNDRMEFVATKIRIPTAHMDPFSVFLQLVADHLLNSNSTVRQQQTFDEVRSAVSFFTSDMDNAQRLNEVTRQECFRGSHWYPTAPPAIPANGAHAAAGGN